MTKEQSARCAALESQIAEAPALVKAAEIELAEIRSELPAEYLTMARERRKAGLTLAQSLEVVRSQYVTDTAAGV